MALLKLLTAPNLELHKNAMPVDSFDSKIQEFAQDMVETMKYHDGIGLASIQVADDSRFEYKELGEGFRPQPSVIVVAVEDIYVAVNPQILEQSDEKQVFEEGCLSIPGPRAKVERSSKIKVKFQDVDGKFCEKEFEGLEATCWQHEIDHINGILFPQRINKMQQLLFWKKYGQGLHKFRA